MFIAQVLEGPSKQQEQIIQIEHNIMLVRIPTGWRQTGRLFTSVAEDLIPGLPRNKSR